MDRPWQSARILSADLSVALDLPAFLSLYDSFDFLLECTKTSGRIIMQSKLPSPRQAVLPATVRWALTWSQGVGLEEQQWGFVLYLIVLPEIPGCAAVTST